MPRTRRTSASILIALVLALVAPLVTSAPASAATSPVVGLAATPTGAGQWLAHADGTVSAFGDAPPLGSVTGRLNQPITGIAATPTGNGYWLVARDGGIFSFGDASFAGSTGAMRLNRPIVGMTATRSGRGYWLVADDGGIFSFGDAAFAGSTGAMRLNRPILGMAATPSGRGYWLVADDGGIFTFGDAPFLGSTGALHLVSPIVGIASTATGRGYWLVAGDGGVFTFGDAPFLGSGAGLGAKVVGIVAKRAGGYAVVAGDGRTLDVANSGSTAAASRDPRPAPAADGSLPFPGPGTVGHLADLPGHNSPATVLTRHEGDLTTTADGQIIEAMDITGSVIVKHKDVVIRRNRIGLGVTTAADAAHPNPSASVEWNTIGPEHGVESPFLAGNGRGENLTFYRNELFGGIDLFNFYAGGNITIVENWAYGPYQMLSDPYQQDQGSTVSHSDGIQVHMTGAHYKILRNRFDLFLFRSYAWTGTPNKSTQALLSPRPTARANLGVAPNVAPMTTGFLFQQTNGRLDDIVFDGNRIDGDCYRYFSFPKNAFGESATNIKIVNNTIVRRFPTFGRNQLIGVDTPGNVTWSNNVDELGTAIPPLAGMSS